LKKKPAPLGSVDDPNENTEPEDRVWLNENSAPVDTVDDPNENAEPEDGVEAPNGNDVLISFLWSCLGSAPGFRLPQAAHSTLSQSFLTMQMSHSHDPSVALNLVKRSSLTSWCPWSS